MQETAISEKANKKYQKYFLKPSTQDNIKIS